MTLYITLAIAAIFTLSYAALIGTYTRWFLKVPVFKSDSKSPLTSFSIIIPARNEAEQIQACLASVLAQDYPQHLFEVILVDDHSTDNTASLAEELISLYPNLRVLRLEQVLKNKSLNSYKKKAIEVAIGIAQYDWIVTTDADCMVTSHWLRSFDSFIREKNPVFIAAPVAFTHPHSFVTRFQSLDFTSLQGITAATVHQGFHSMCNGANLVYKKSVFAEVNGFTGIDNIASGDDMLLMHKIYQKYPSQIAFLLSQDALVKTTAMPNWRSFLNQRIRWASKADKFQDKRIFFVLLFIYLYNCLFVILPVMAIWHPLLLMVWLVMLVLKTIIELSFMLPVSKFFQSEKLLWWFPVMQPFHIAYTIIAGWLGKFGKYSWKGRTVK